MVRSDRCFAEAGSTPLATCAAAAARNEFLAGGRAHPCLGRLMIDRCPGRNISLQPRNGEIPADPDCPWTELIPMILDHRGVLKRQPRLASFCRQLDIDPAHRAAEFPRRCKMGRRRTRRDGPAGISLELVLSTEPEISLDRQEPARNALWAGHCVPEIVDAGLV